MTRLRTLLLGSAAAAALFAASPTWAQQVVTCVNCNTLSQGIASYARQLLQLNNEITIAERAILNTTALGGTSFTSLTPIISRLLGLSNQAWVLSGQAGTMVANLNNPSGYAGNALPQFARWQQELVADDAAIANAVQAAGNVLGAQQTDLVNAANNLDTLQQQGLATVGRQQTLQTLNGAAASIGQTAQHAEATNAALQQAIITAELRKADMDAYVRNLSNQQEQAGMQAACSAASSTGFAQPAVCASVGATAGTLPTVPAPASPSAPITSYPISVSTTGTAQ